MKIAKVVRESTAQSEESKAKKLKKTEELSSQESDGDDDNDDEPIGEIDFNMPKPGPHAKAGEWRKWKMMKRAIRQKREEKRIIKQKQKEMEAEESKKSNAEKQASEEEEEINGSKPAKRDYSLSIAISGSVMSKIKSKELRTCLAGQIARVAVLYSVDEIIVYNELPSENKFSKENDEQFIKILEYLECPQYLRKALFPPNKHLEHVGLLVPLEAPHHFRINDEWNYREGVTTDIPSKDGKGSWVDIGLMNKIQIDRKLEPGIRVTVKKSDDSSPKKLKGQVVSPETPRSESGLYWGYQVRYAESFRKILTQSSFKAHYDLKIGVNLTNKLSFEKLDEIVSSKRPKRVLIVYGGVDGGIETAIEADENFKSNKIEEVFDLVCQGENPQFTSRSMRLEEALLISLSTIVPTFNRVWLHN